MLNTIIQNYWYKPRINKFSLIYWVLYPLEKVFRLVVYLRKKLYTLGILQQYRPPKPVIVIGNLTVGGTGKTPLTVATAQLLSAHNIQVGIITRGYKSKVTGPVLVEPDSDPAIFGDEAVLLANKSNCPVVIGQDRALAADFIAKNFMIDLIISDDGLQHYSLARDLEIAVMDNDYQLGNQYMLPLGPCREAVTRLARCDMIILNRKSNLEDDFKEIPAPKFASKVIYMQSRLSFAYKLRQESSSLLSNKVSLEYFKNKKVHALAAIAFPEKFFQMLRALDIEIIPHPMRDHQQLFPTDFDFSDNLPILITEKDAVKCTNFNLGKDVWVVVLAAQLSSSYDNEVVTRVKQLIGG